MKKGSHLGRRYKPICHLCEKTIFNKNKSSLYCKTCTEVVKLETARFSYHQRKKRGKNGK